MDKIKGLLLTIKGRIDAIVKNRRSFFTIISVLLLLVLIDVNNVQKSKVPIKVQKAVKGDIVVTISAPGVVKATSAQMAARMPGRVEKILVKEGSEVKKGDVLIKIDNYDNAIKEYRRIKSLYVKGFASSQQLENAKYNLDGAAIRSPMDGTVSSISVDEGEAAIIGSPIITVTNSKGMSIEIQIDQVDIADVRQGQEVKILADAYPDEVFMGKLSFLNNEAELKSVAGRVRMDEEDKVFRGKVTLDKPTGKLFHGMNVDAEIITKKTNNILIVPREAVLGDSDKFNVFVVHFGHVSKKEVKLSFKDAVNVGIKSGLKEGDTVAISNILKLKNNARIKIEK